MTYKRGMTVSEIITLGDARKAFNDLEKTNAYIDEGGFGYIVQEGIRKPLAAIGKTLAALDPSGESTVKQIENRLQQAKIRIQIRSARHEFSDFETATANRDEGTITLYQRQIKRRLADAGEELSVLDPSGRSTNLQIEQRLQQAANRLRLRIDPVRYEKLKQARKRFADIEISASGDLFGVDAILLKSEITAAHVTMAALDPTGRSTNQQMQERLDRALDRGHLLRARQTFASMETSTTGDLMGVDEILLKNDLSAAHASMADLDPTGRNTSQEMQERLDKAVARGHALRAIKDISQATPHALANAKKELSAIIGYLDATKPFNTAAKKVSLQEITELKPLEKIRHTDLPNRRI